MKTCPAVSFWILFLVYGSALHDHYVHVCDYGISDLVRSSLNASMSDPCVRWAVILLSLLAFSSCLWSVRASAVVCEAVKRDISDESSCQPVDKCNEATLTAGEEPKGELGCSEDKFCGANLQSDGDAINDTNGSYSINGLQNFSSNGSIGYCPNANFNKGGGCVEHKNTPYYTVKDLKITYEPIDMKYYRVSLTWNKPRSLDNVEAYRLLVKGPPIPSPGYCICINKNLNLSEYSLTLEYPTGNNNGELIVNIQTLPYSLHAAIPEREKSFDLPDNCSDHTSGLPYNSTTCGLPYYGKPRNVKVNRINATHTVLSWDEPCYQAADACGLLKNDIAALPHSGPNTYYLTATVNLVNSYFVIHNTTMVILAIPDLVDFKLYTHVPCSDCKELMFGGGCSQPATMQGEQDNDTCCVPTSPSPSPSSPPPPPSSPSPSSNIVPTGTNQLAIYIPVGVVMLLALLLLVLLLTIVWCMCKRPPEPPVSSSPTDSEHILKPPLCPVFVVFSPRTQDEEARTILQYLVNILGESPYGIESSTYAMADPRQSQCDYVEEWHGKASAILCVCNQEFFEDWMDAILDVDGSPRVVRTLKCLFEGDMQRGWGIENYAVVKMRDTDDQYIPPLLRSRPVYMFHQIEHIARFAHNVPQYCT